MNRGILTISVFGILMVQSCLNRSDKVFSANDELHYIILYDIGNEFELLYNGFNTATGTYSLHKDTIHLTYTDNEFKEFNPNEELTRKIFIDVETNRVRSIDDRMQFCATIDLDKRKIKN